jgi:hypothetical protein
MYFVKYHIILNLKKISKLNLKIYKKNLKDDKFQLK